MTHTPHTPHTEEYRGLIIRIEHDEYPTNPRGRDSYLDNIGTFIAWSRDYVSPDPNRFGDIEDFKDYLRERRAERRSADAGVIAYAVKYENYQGERRIDGPYSEDADPVALIYITYEEIRAAYKVNRITPKIRAEVIERLAGEVEEYSHYASGNVWAAVIADKSGEIVDSCSGYSGDWQGEDSYILSEARQMADHIAAARDRGIDDSDAAADMAEEIAEYTAHMSRAA